MVKILPAGITRTYTGRRRPGFNTVNWYGGYRVGYFYDWTQDALSTRVCVARVVVTAADDRFRFHWSRHVCSPPPYDRRMIQDDYDETTDRRATVLNVTWTAIEVFVHGVLLLLLFRSDGERENRNDCRGDRYEKQVRWVVGGYRRRQQVVGRKKGPLSRQRSVGHRSSSVRVRIAFDVNEFGRINIVWKKKITKIIN